MADDRRDNPGIRVPPAFIYLLPLVLGLLLDRRSHVPFLPSGVVRIIGWPLIGGGGGECLPPDDPPPPAPGSGGTRILTRRIVVGDRILAPLIIGCL